MFIYLCFYFFAITFHVIESACPNKCSGHGKCGPNDRCECDQFFTFGDCSGRTCPYSRAWIDTPISDTTAHEYAECSNRGICDRATGECICDDGFTGSACRRTACPENCNGHGRCVFIEELTSNYNYQSWDREKFRGCDCDPGYEGHACQKLMCPKGDDPLTSGQTNMRQYIFIHSASALTTGAQFYLSFTDPYGATYTTSKILIGASSTATCANIQAALYLLPTRVFDDVHVSYTTPLYSVTREEPDESETEELTTTRVPSLAFSGHSQLCLVEFKSKPGESGYQNLLKAYVDATPSGHQPMSTGLSSVVIDIGEHIATSGVNVVSPLTELAPCSNRGICDATTGKCACFIGHTGIACEKQEALV